MSAANQPARGMTDPPPSALEVEQAGLRAWPALESRLLGDWHLRAAGGYTKRANGVTVLGAPDRSLDQAVDLFEAWMHARDLPPIFRLPSFVPENGLAALLAARGYAPLDPTTVMTRPLPEGTQEDPAVHPVPPAAWLEARAALRGRPSPPVHVQMLGAIETDLRCALLWQETGPVAFGMAVVDGPLVGLFDLYTAPDVRRLGLGSRLLGTLLSWGHEAGARHAYLQVMESNAGAHAMYARLGFMGLYSYHYLTTPPSSF